MKQQVLINKVPNKFGNYMTQRNENGKWILEGYKTYEDAITTFFMKGYTETYLELKHSIILEREYAI